MSAELWIHLLGQLAVCHRHLRRQLAAITLVESLNDTEFLLLCGCRTGSAGPRSQQELAASIGLSASQASGVFETLRVRGLIAVAPNVRDRRRQSWQITAAGEQCIASIAGQLQPLLSEWRKSISPSDQQVVLEALRHWSTVTLHDPSPVEASTNSRATEAA